MPHKPDPITKAYSYWDEGEDFNVGDFVDLEDYPPYPEPESDWNGCYHCVIVDTEGPDADVDDYGKAIYYQPYAYVAIVCKNPYEVFVEKVYINSLFKQGELYSD